jgi:hypothetical protein
VSDHDLPEEVIAKRVLQRLLGNTRVYPNLLIHNIQDAIYSVTHRNIFPNRIDCGTAIYNDLLHKFKGSRGLHPAQPYFGGIEIHDAPWVPDNEIWLVNEQFLGDPKYNVRLIFENV